MAEKRIVMNARGLRRLLGPKLDNPTLPREGEEIGGGWLVLRRGRTTKRLKTVRWVFEHPSFEKAQEEAQRLREAFPDQTFEILSRVTEV